MHSKLLMLLLRKSSLPRVSPSIQDWRTREKGFVLISLIGTDASKFKFSRLKYLFCRYVRGNLKIIKLRSIGDINYLDGIFHLIHESCVFSTRQLTQTFTKKYSTRSALRNNRSQPRMS